jgi:hypothetical protein
MPARIAAFGQVDDTAALPIGGPLLSAGSNGCLGIGELVGEGFLGEGAHEGERLPFGGWLKHEPVAALDLIDDEVFAFSDVGVVGLAT